MLAVLVPPETSQTVRVFLQGWSNCMMSMMYMSEDDKRQIEKLFKEKLEPQAHCPEMLGLDKALITYLMHKCDSKEAVGSMAKGGT